MPADKSKISSPILSEVLPKFLEYARVELLFSPQSLVKYADCCRQIEKSLGDLPVGSLSREDVLRLKACLIEKGNGTSRQIGILSALKQILRFSQGHLGVEVLNPDSIILPTRARRDVEFLTVEEVHRVVSAIEITTLTIYLFMRHSPIVVFLRFLA